MNGVITTTTIRAWLQNLAHDIYYGKAMLNSDFSREDVAKHLDGLHKRCAGHEAAIFELGPRAVIPGDAPTGNMPEGGAAIHEPATRAADAREIALQAIEKEAARADRAEAALKEVWEKLYAVRSEPDKINVMIMHERAAIMGGKA